MSEASDVAATTATPAAVNGTATAVQPVCNHGYPIRECGRCTETAEPIGPYLRGAEFILDEPDEMPTIWGRGGEVLWVEGGALMIAGPPGVGKTTLVGQLLFARLGLLDSVLGYPVAPADHNVLYLAMDRPRQIARALKRLASESDREELNEFLAVRKGPPPRDMAKEPDLLLRMCLETQAKTVFIDSVKDAVVGISSDEAGGGFNRAVQACINEGIEVVCAHHTRKSGSDNVKPSKLDDVYGSTWLTSGMDSVIGLWGEAGDAVVDFTHIKPPQEIVGPFDIAHDTNTGLSSIMGRFDPFQLLAGSPHGVTAVEAAFAKKNGDPSKSEAQTMRNKLNRMAADGVIHRVEGSGHGRGRTEDRYYQLDRSHSE